MDAFVNECITGKYDHVGESIIYGDTDSVYFSAWPVLKKEVEQARKEYKLSYKMKPKDIMTFVNGLHNVQLDMIETTVAMKEKQGFPEAMIVIKHIMEKK
jgi:hypothetical protein